MAISSINPYTGQTINTYETTSLDDAKALVAKAEYCFAHWKHTSFLERSVLMRKASALLNERKEKYALLMTQEMGKPITEGISEIEKCANCCEYYAEHAQTFLKDEMIATDANKSFVAYRPIGPVLAVMPWNFPFWQVFRFAAPALMAGNVGVLKHASNVPGCALAIEEVFRDAGFPSGAFTTLLIAGKEVNEIIKLPGIKAVTLTGSTGAGSAVAEAAGKALKKTVLELGGSDAYIVLHDADITKAAETCAKSRMINTGQSCIAAKRFIVVKSRMAEFEEEFIKQMKHYVMGDPTDAATKLGPMARHNLRDDLHGQVKKSVDKGAKILMGGEVPKMAGAFYPATVLSNVQKGMPAHDEELFGPVAALIVAEDEKDAFRIANDSVFGLGGAIFTEDVERGEHLAKYELDAGSCFVNAFVRSDQRLPFGGIKDSGYGRELSYFGIREFVNVKTVYVA